MRPKIKHLRHPLRTASLVCRVAATYLEIYRFGRRSRRHFKGDDRYDLKNVSKGFVSRTGDTGGDADLLERICTAYNRAVLREESAPVAYRATGWWQQVRHDGLGRVIEALRTHNTDALGRMYANFFRDACSTGLVGQPFGMTKAYSGGVVKEIHRRNYLGDALYRIDHWTKQTGSRFHLRELAGPEIGNPFGVSIFGTLVRMGSPYQHYAAQRVRECLDSKGGTVAEIGGGFGDMAYYLLRDQERTRYLDFDVPESIALASYYLMKAFPHLKFLLYGEAELTKEQIERADVVLMPVFELGKVPSGSVDVTFSSHSMSDLSTRALDEYLKTIARITNNYFLYIGVGGAAQSISNLTAQRRYGFRLAETKASGWNAHKFANAGEMECLYRVGSSVRPAVEFAAPRLVSHRD